MGDFNASELERGIVVAAVRAKVKFENAEIFMSLLFCYNQALCIAFRNNFIQS